MAALPYMRFYPADYLADTAHLSATQHGIYLLLIMNYWQRGGPLPDNDERLAKIARVSMRDWKRNREEIAQFFTVVESHWRHSRIDAELSRVEAKSLKCKDAAQASVERRLSERSTNAERTPIYTEADKIIPLAKANGDSDQAFWEGAKSYLQLESKNPGALIGKWCRDYGKETTANAITRAQLERPVQRVPFIEGALRKQNRAQPTVPL